MMPVNLSIKNAPDELVSRLKERARANHRSLQGELLAILEEVVREDYALEEPRMRYRDELTASRRKLSPREALEHMRQFDVRTGGESATELVRKARDERGKLTVEEISGRVKKLGLTRRDEAAKMIREDRDR